VDRIVTQDGQGQRKKARIYSLQKAMRLAEEKPREAEAWNKAQLETQS